MQNQFLKSILHLRKSTPLYFRKSTPLYMLYVEMGRRPIEHTIKCRVIKSNNSKFR